MWKSPVHSIVLSLLLAAGLRGQAPVTSGETSDTDNAIGRLQQIARELNEGVKTFNMHLGQAISRHDHGYRVENGRPVQGADVDLIGGPPDVTWGAIRKFASFRMWAASREGGRGDEPAVADLEHIQQLILEARKRVDASTANLRRLLVVSVAGYVPGSEAAAKGRHDQLLKARVTAEETAKRAMLELPLDQPDDSSPEETAEKAWDLLGRKVSSADGRVQTTPVLPLRFERRKRVTLLNEMSYRMAVTDSGIDDEEGRHLFYQEQWVQRGQSVIRYRWRVAVEKATGEQVLVRRYPPHELRGVLQEVYNRRDRDYAWYLEPADDGTGPPRREELEAALAEVGRAREGIRAATREYQAGMRKALAQQDELQAAIGEPPVDSGLPEGMRQGLFAIRAHLARVPAALDAESAVRKTMERAESAVRALEPLAAWSNRTSKPAADWAQVLDRSDREIDAVRNAETEAVKTLPPESTHAEEQFPALEKNTIIRMRQPRARNPEDTSIRCLQEVWRMDTGSLGTREVRRVVSLILIDPKTGRQTRVGGATKYYKASPGDLLEEIFDEYAADEVSPGS